MDTSSNVNKKQIRQYSTYDLSHYDFDGSIQDIILRLNNLLKDGFTHIDYDTESFRPFFTREETDEEYYLRTSQEEQNRQKRKKLYETLKKEFENE